MLARLLAMLGFGRSEAPPAPATAPPGALPVLLAGEAPPAPSVPLAALLRVAGFASPDAWATHLAEPMMTRGIRGERRVAAFLATIAHESNGGRRLEEDLYYSADRIRAVWPARFADRAAAARVAGDPYALAEAVYGGRLGNDEPGAGWLYRGRGLIQITGAANYGAAADALSLPLLSDPGLAARPAEAARIAAWWWAAHGCNELADTGDATRWRRRVNGGLVGLADVQRVYEALLS